MSGRWEAREAGDRCGLDGEETENTMGDKMSETSVAELQGAVCCQGVGRETLGGTRDSSRPGVPQGAFLPDPQPLSHSLSSPVPLSPCSPCLHSRAAVTLTISEHACHLPVSPCLYLCITGRLGRYPGTQLVPLRDRCPSAAEGE